MNGLDGMLIGLGLLVLSINLSYVGTEISNSIKQLAEAIKKQ